MLEEGGTQKSQEDIGVNLKCRAHVQGQLFSGALSLGVNSDFHF